jgi:hypothetical protein
MILIALLVAGGAVIQLHAQLRLRTQASGFSLPVAFVQDPVDRAVQFVVQQDGHIRVVRGATVLSADFIDLSPAIVAGANRLARLRLPRTRLPAAASSSTSPTVWRHRGRAFPAAEQRRQRPASRFDLRWAAASPRVHRTALCEPQRRQPRVRARRLYIGLGDSGSVTTRTIAHRAH